MDGLKWYIIRLSFAKWFKKDVRLSIGNIPFTCTHNLGRHEIIVSMWVGSGYEIPKLGVHRKLIHRQK